MASDVVGELIIGDWRPIPVQPQSDFREYRRLSYASPIFFDYELGDAIPIIVKQVRRLAYVALNGTFRHETEESTQIVSPLIKPLPHSANRWFSCLPETERIPTDDMQWGLVFSLRASLKDSASSPWQRTSPRR